MTFFAWEAYLRVKHELTVPGLKADAFRRNVVVEGMHLNSLIGSHFTLGGVEFEGMGEAKPCLWMNHAVAPGAEAFLRGHGGLRAKILTDGTLQYGATELCAHGLLALQ